MPDRTRSSTYLQGQTCTCQSKTAILSPQCGPQSQIARVCTRCEAGTMLERRPWAGCWAVAGRTATDEASHGTHGGQCCSVMRMYGSCGLVMHEFMRSSRNLLRVWSLALLLAM